MVNWNTRRKKSENRVEEIFEEIRALKFPKLVTDTKPQTQDTHTHKNAENTEEDKYQHSKQTGYIIFKLQKTKEKKDNLKANRSELGLRECPYIQRKKVRIIGGIIQKK